MKKVYLNGVNVVIEGVSVEPVFIPVRAARFQPRSGQVIISDYETKSDYRINLEDLTGDEDQTFSSMNLAINYLSGFIGALNVNTSNNNNNNQNMGTISIETEDIGQTITLQTSGGNLANMSSPNSNTSYQIDTTNMVLNGWTQVLINATEEPVFDPEEAKKEVGADFLPNTNMYLNVINKGGTQGVVYKFSYEKTAPNIISNDAYSEEDWDGVENEAPSKNSVRDIIETIKSDLTIPDDFSFDEDEKEFIVSQETPEEFQTIIGIDKVVIKNNKTTGGWARGFSVSDTADNNYTQFGVRGNGQNVNYAYIGGSSAAGETALKWNGQNVDIASSNTSAPAEPLNVKDGALIVQSDDTVKVGKLLNLPSYTVSTLPTGNEGALAYVTDANNVSYRAIATGGGTESALVLFDKNNNWIYH